MRRWTPRKRQATDKPPVVTNTTPLITLAGIELLDLLPHLYGEVWTPRIVLDEYQVKVPPSEVEVNFCMTRAQSVIRAQNFITRELI